MKVQLYTTSSNAIKIFDGITFNSHMGLPKMRIIIDAILRIHDCIPNYMQLVIQS